MIRHYLPAIFALIALLIMIFFFPFGKRADDFGQNFALKAQVVSGNICGQNKVDIKLSIELDSLTPTFKDFVPGTNRLRTGPMQKYDPPVIVKRINACCMHCGFDTYYKGNRRLWADVGAKSCDVNFSDEKIDTFDRGNINEYDASWIEYKKNPREIIEYTFLQAEDTPNGDKSVSLKDIPQLASKLSGNPTDLNTKILYDAKIFISSGNAKGGLDGVDSATNSTNGDLTDLRDGNFNKTFTVCKDTNNNKVCDRLECSAPPKAFVCGDSFLDSGEQCDHGPSNGKAGDTCTDKCQTVAVCGNSAVEAPEQCDHGAQNGKDGQCTKDCKNTTPTFRSIPVQKSSSPIISIQPTLADLEQLSFQNKCSSCTLSTDQDPTKFLGGQAATQQNFTLMATLTASDKSLSQTIVAVGNYKQESHLFTKKGVEYGNLGEDPNTQYLPSFLIGQENEYYFRIPIGSGIETVTTTATPLPSLKDTPFKNGDPYYFLLAGDDSSGVTHLMVVKGRYWDLSAVVDRGDLKKCVATVGSLPQAAAFAQSSSGFQMLLDSLTLCQKK